MKKREMILIYILFIGVFLSFGSLQVAADGYDKYEIYINNEKIDKSTVVYEKDGLSYIPINQLLKGLGFSIKEDKAANAIQFTSKTKNIKVTNGIYVETNQSKGIDLVSPLLRKDNNLYIPIIALVDLFEYQVEVLDDIKCIRIATQSDVMPAGKILDNELNRQFSQSKTNTSQSPRVAYLTFDDGIDSKITPMILDILKQYDIKGTFFIIGNTIEKNKAILKRMIEEGHIIANHTYTHKKENVYSSGVGLKTEIEKTNAAFFNAAGITTSLFRPPYGGTYIRSEEFKAVLTPYRTILWNVDSMDSKSISIKSSEIVNSVIQQVKNKKSAIIIMHDSSTHIETVKALPEIIRYLKENGFAMLPIKEDTDLYYQYK